MTDMATITGDLADQLFSILGAETYLVDGTLAVPWHIAAARCDSLQIIGFACSDHGCCYLAMFRVFWPGQTGLKCQRHAEAWARVATTMGFELQMRSIDVATGDDDWAKRVSLLELR
jgi:hypothetical protein